MTEYSIFDAIRSEDSDKLLNLLNKGVNLYQRDSFQDTPLHCAVRQGNLELVTLLLENGADVNAKGEAGRTPLHVAVRECEGDCEIVDKLILQHPNFELTDNGGRTALMESSGYPECAERLIQAGATYDLNSATSLGDLDYVCKLLCESGLSSTPSPSTILLDAIYARKNRQEILEELLKHGADIDEPRSYPPVYAALHDAFNMRDLTVLNEILKHGPDTQHTPAPLLQTARELVKGRKDDPAEWQQTYNEIIQLLIDFYAKS